MYTLYTQYTVIVKSYNIVLITDDEIIKYNYTRNIVFETLFYRTRQLTERKFESGVDQQVVSRRTSSTGHHAVAHFEFGVQRHPVSFAVLQNQEELEKKK